MNKGENCLYSTAIKPNELSQVRFKDCIFTVKCQDGTKTKDVTGILNAMIQNYRGNTNEKLVFKLDDPGLSAFSFYIDGFNDNKNHPDGNWLDTNSNQTVTLDGKYKYIQDVIS